jgi:quercetin dioxygenase-like cupin family protein
MRNTRFVTSAALLLLPLAAACGHGTQGSASPAAAAPTAAGGEMRIRIARSGSQPPGPGPAEYFSGSVRVEPLFKANAPARASGSLVTFAPGARSAWHTHPLGQTLIVTAGTGRVQQWGGPVEEIRAGDVVSIPPGRKHWHGAAPATSMSHIAVQESLDGKAVEWLEKVSDAQYGR